MREFGQQPVEINLLSLNGVKQFVHDVEKVYGLAEGSQIHEYIVLFGELMSLAREKRLYDVMYQIVAK